jgi:uncharacterized membrane protein
MPSRPIVCALCALVALLALPLALQLVAPNPYFGLRTPETSASASAWYEGNLVAGTLFIEGALMAAAILCLMPARWVGKGRWAPAAIFALALALSLAASLAYVRTSL